jgi:hypothetical protein
MGDEDLTEHDIEFLLSDDEGQAILDEALNEFLAE